jgi:hypothetical protein
LNARTLTTAYNNATLAAYTLGTEYTYDVTTAVQEVLDRAGFIAGNTLAILVHDNGSSANQLRNWASYENTTYTEPILQIVYNSPAGIAITPYMML